MRKRGREQHFSSLRTPGPRGSFAFRGQSCGSIGRQSRTALSEYGTAGGYSRRLGNSDDGCYGDLTPGVCGLVTPEYIANSWAAPRGQTTCVTGLIRGVRARSLGITSPLDPARLKTTLLDYRVEYSPSHQVTVIAEAAV